MAIIAIGFLLIAAAAFGIYTGYSQNDWVIAALAWAGLIIGVLAILFGFGKRVSDSMDDQEKGVNGHAHEEIRSLVQAMGVVAMADDKLRDQEIKTIARIHEDMLGIKISEDEVNEILSEFGPEFDITKRLVARRAQISPMMKRIIIQSCHLVMVSDLEIVQQEETRIHEIGLALGFDQSEVDDLIASAGI